MSNYRKILISVLLFTFILCSAASAQVGNVVNPPGDGAPTTAGNVQNPGTPMERLTNPLKVDSLAGLISAFVQVASYIAVLFGVLALVWVGFQFVLARGNSERMKELKNWLLWIVVGLAIIIGARVIISIVINTLQATGVVDKQVIQSAKKAL